MLIRKDPIPIIESNLDKMTATEKEVAYFFLKNKTINNLNTDFFCKEIHVSKATLTRFSKKCGYSGFIEFLYQYREIIREKSENTVYRQWNQNVLSDYIEILNKTCSIINESQLEKIQKMILSYPKIFFYGKGSSALALKDMKTRFMRLGIMGELIDDDDVIQWNSQLVDESCLIIAASISGKTKIVIESLITAKKNGAKIILMTTKNFEKNNFCDELLLLASTQNLSHGNRISPQFPILVITDCLFSYFFKIEKRKDYYYKTIIHKEDLL